MFRPAIFLSFLVILLAFSGTSAADPDNQGFIHGTLASDSGDTLTGFLRWDNEEAYWNDIRFCTPTGI